MLNKEAIQLVTSLMDLEFYRFKRYKAPCTLVIFESDDMNIFQSITNQMRRTDLCQYVDTQRFVMILGHTDGQEAAEAINKFLSILHDETVTKVYVGYSEFAGLDRSSLDSVKRANAALKTARKPNSKNIVRV
jgi:GGDEF domain-containing protein